MRFGFSFSESWVQVIPSAGIEGTFVENVRPSGRKVNSENSVENDVRTMECCGPFHPFPPNYGGKFHQGFNVVVRLEQREFPSQKEQENDAGGPHINRWGENVVSDRASREMKDILPPDCSPHLNSTSGARKPRVPARFAFECGLREIYTVVMNLYSRHTEYLSLDNRSFPVLICSFPSHPSVLYERLDDRILMK